MFRMVILRGLIGDNSRRYGLRPWVTARRTPRESLTIGLWRGRSPATRRHDGIRTGGRGSAPGLGGIWQSSAAPRRS